MKCLVFGGAGFIGSHLVDRLLEQSHDVRVFAAKGFGTQNIDHVKDKIDVVFGDFLNEEDVKKSLDGVDAVFHLVCLTLPQSSLENPIYDLKNISSSVRMLQLAVDAGVKKVLFSSSGGTVYGDPKQIPIPEDHPKNPTTPYAVSKLAVEQYLDVFYKLHGMDYAVLRYSNPYGERQNPYGKQGAVSVFMGLMKQGKQPTIYGDGEMVRDYVYICDAADASVRALEKDTRDKIFNIGSGRGISVNDLIGFIAEATGREVKPQYAEGRKGEVSKVVLDITRAASQLGWRPSTQMTEGLKKTWEWILKQE